MPRRSRRQIKFWKYYKEWIDTYKNGRIRPVSLDKYYLIDNQIKEMAPNLVLGKMTRMDVQQIVNKYGQTHEKPTVLDFMHHIEKAIHDAAYEGWVSPDPYYEIFATSQVPNIKKQKFLPSESDIHKLAFVFEKHKDDPFARIFDFDLRTGLRFAEVLGITPSEVNEAQKTLYVNQCLDYKSPHQHITPLMKNKYSHRVIVLDERALQDIALFIHGSRSNEPVLALACTKPARALKKKRCHIRVYNSTFDKKLAIYCKEAGVPKITFHGLRHTHASYLILKGISIESVAKRLGHGNTVTTQKTYIHVLDELKQKDDRKILNALSGLGA